MREKFYVRERDGDGIVGLRYDEDNRELLVGGPARWRTFGETVLEAFGVGALEWEVNVSRARMLVDGVPRDAWRGGLERLRAEGYELEAVDSFRRFMS